MGSFFYEKRSENDIAGDIFIGDICDHAFPAHVHDVVEIICLLSGSASVTIEGEAYELFAGDIAVFFPMVAHSYERVSADAQGITWILLQDAIAEFRKKFLTMLPETPILRAAEKRPELDGVISACRRAVQKREDSLRLGFAHLFLAYLFTCMPLKLRDKEIQKDLTHQALQYISEHFTEALTLESIARALGVSRIHLSHLFSQQLKINFRLYVNKLRIDYACSLLKDSTYSISEIAYLCGYGNPRTFNRAFLAHKHVQPNQYRTNRQ